MLKKNKNLPKYSDKVAFVASIAINTVVENKDFKKLGYEGKERLGRGGGDGWWVYKAQC